MMMMRLVSLLAATACLTPLAACANMDGQWPSLKTPAEQRAGACDDLQTAMAEMQAPPAQATGAQATGAQAQPPATDTGTDTAPNLAAPNLAAVTTRLAEEQADFNAALENWNRQRTATESAVNAARNAAPASETWATAELELTRFNQNAARFEQIRDSITRLTGDLALLAANGANVSATLAEAGHLLRRIDDALNTHQAAIGPLQTSLPR